MVDLFVSVDSATAELPASVLTALEASTSAKGIVQLAGDLAGTSALPTVVAASTTVAGKVELATSAETITGTDTTRAVTAAGLAAKVTSETVLGIVELATAAETTTGTDNTRAVHPAGLKVELDKKITAFADPNADRIVFWDDSAGAFVALEPLTPLAISGTTLFINYATTTADGVIELATSAETVTGTDTIRAVTPAGVLATRGLAVGINAQTGTTYAPVLADQGKAVTLSNAGAITVTMPSNATTAFPIGTQIAFNIIGAGMATFVAGAGATVQAYPSAVSKAQYCWVGAIKIATDTWSMTGALA